MKYFTVDELIEHLTMLRDLGHGDKDVWLEGCDCDNPWAGDSSLGDGVVSLTQRKA